MTTEERWFEKYGDSAIRQKNILDAKEKIEDFQYWLVRLQSICPELPTDAIDIPSFGLANITYALSEILGKLRNKNEQA